MVQPVLSQPQFDTTYGLHPSGPPLRPWEEIKRIGRKLWTRRSANKRTCSQKVYLFFAGWFPIISWLPRYDFKRLALADLISGITIGVMNVPQGMAYALVAKLPPVCGLYTSFIPTLFYFAMGTSRQCSLGAFAIVSIMTSKIVTEYAGSATAKGGLINSTHALSLSDSNNSVHVSPQEIFSEQEIRAIKVAGAAAVVAGCWQLLFGLLGFGGLTVYLSDQLVQGFTCGSAFHVFTSQLSAVFGLKGLPEFHGALKIPYTYIEFFKIIGTSHPPAMIISAVTMTILVIIKYGINQNPRYKKLCPVPIPAELIVVIIGSSVSYSFDFEKRYKVSIIKTIPRGMPPLTIPSFELVPNMLGDTFTIAIVSFAITVTLGMLFANKHNYSISPNQEFRAMGTGNIVGGFFQCFPSGASLARSAVQDSVGGRTQLVSLVQCSIVLVVILALGPLMEPLPRACLGSIVMIAVLRILEQVVGLVHLWRISFVDWTIFLVVFLSVLILDVDYGIAIGAVYAIMTVMFRLQKPKVRALGRIPGTDLYQPLDSYTAAQDRAEVRIIRVDAPIYFANAAYIKTRLYNLAGLNSAMQVLKQITDDTEDIHPKTYAFSNTLAMEDQDEEPVMQYDRRMSRTSVNTRGVVSNGSAVSLQVLAESEAEPEAEDQPQQEYSATVPSLHVIIDCAEVCFVDMTGVAFLKKTAEECKNIGVQLLLASANKPVRDMMEICGAHDFIKPSQMFVRVHDAVLYALSLKAEKGLITKM